MIRRWLTGSVLLFMSAMCGGASLVTEGPEDIEALNSDESVVVSAAIGDKTRNVFYAAVSRLSPQLSGCLERAFIYRLDHLGRKTSEWLVYAVERPTQNWIPHYAMKLALALNGDIWLGADWLSDARVIRISPNGEILFNRVIATRRDRIRISSMATDGDELVLVGSSSDHPFFMRLDRDGQVLIRRPQETMGKGVFHAVECYDGSCRGFGTTAREGNRRQLWSVRMDRVGDPISSLFVMDEDAEEGRVISSINSRVGTMFVLYRAHKQSNRKYTVRVFPTRGESSVGVAHNHSITEPPDSYPLTLLDNVLVLPRSSGESNIDIGCFDETIQILANVIVPMVDRLYPSLGCATLGDKILLLSNHISDSDRRRSRVKRSLATFVR